MMPTIACTYAIIGSSAAAISALNTLAAVDPTAPVVCISRSESKPYNTCFLIDVAKAIKTPPDIALSSAHAHATFLFKKEVVSIEPNNNRLILSDNSIILFQKLLIATGARPSLPPFASLPCAGVFTFHTLSDTTTLLDWITAEDVRSAVVVGGGITGLECADMLHAKGIAVTIIEREARLLSSYVSAESAPVIERALETAKVSVLFNSAVTALVAEKGVLQGVTLESGTYIATQLLVWTTGVHPVSELAHTAGLTLQRKYVMVDASMQTSHPSIFAAGDVVMVKDQFSEALIPSGTWTDAVVQGRIAAYGMAGNPKPYQGAASAIATQFFGIHYLSLGRGNAAAARIEQVSAHGYRCISFHNDIPIAYVYIGTHPATSMDIPRAILARQPLTIKSFF